MVKFILIAFVSFLSMTTLAFAKDIKAVVAPREYCSDHYIEVVSSPSGNKIQLARQRDVLLFEGFDASVNYERGQSRNASPKISEWRYIPKDGWGFENFRNALTPFVLREKDAQNTCLIIRGKEGDTAFELASSKIPVEMGKEYILSFRCRFNKRMVNHHGHKGKYETGIIWLSAALKKLHETPFSLHCDEGDSTDWYLKTITVVSPKKAAQAVIRFGFDLPNLGPEDFVCLDDIQFATVSNRHEPEGEFVSRPLSIEPGEFSLTANADIPEGTSIRFQVRFAGDNDGVPGTWSSFVNYNQTTTPQSPPSQGGDKREISNNQRPISSSQCYKWLQYRAILQTTKPETTPALHSVTINNSGRVAITDNGWTGPDTTPPEIGWRSPTRTENADMPISFRPCDNTGGLGIKSVEAYLDGEKMELLQDKSHGNEYTLKINGPLKPIDRSRSLSAWRIENYQDALTVEHTPEVITVRSKSKDDTYVDTAFKLPSPQITVRENSKYVLTFFVQHTMELTQLQHWGELSSGIRWKDFKGNDVGTPYSMSFGTNDTKWHRNTHTVKSPAGAVSAELCFGWDSPNLKKGDFFSIKNVRLEGPKPELTYAPNLHKMEVKACDLAGNSMHKTWYLLVNKFPVKNIVTLRDDGMTLIDNKPFFPIGIYAVQKSTVNDYNFNTAFQELKEAGFNTAHAYMKERNNDFYEFYSTAVQYGMKVIVMASTGHNSTDSDTIVRDVATEVDQPALLSWYLADDAACHIASSDLKRVHEAVKDVDPFHLTGQADWVGNENRYKGYGNATDIFLPELYPVGKKGKSGVPEVISDMNTVKEELRKAGQSKGVWAIVQAFKGWGWERYPTNEELRAMTYLSIIHGATGITYYTYGGWGNNFGAPYDKHVWNNLKKVVSELAFLHDVLAEKNTIEKCRSSIMKGTEKDGMGYPALNILLKVYQGKHYLFTVNSAQQTIRCQFKPETGNISEVSVMFEDRTLPVKDGVFMDDFKAYDVHVYQW